MMTSYVLLWNPKQWSHNNILRMIRDLEQNGVAKEPWRFMSHKSGKAGDDVFLFKTGEGPRGIFGHGHLFGSPFKDIASDGKLHMMFEVHFDHLVDPFVEFLVPEIILNEIPSWSVQRGSGNVPLGPAVAEQIFNLMDSQGGSLTKAAKEECDALVKALSETERTQMVQQRVGQVVFRKSLLAFWSGKCCISGLAQPELLRASHAKDWAECADGNEREDVYNGLLLAAHLDAAFDAGLIAVNKNGVVQVSPKLKPDAIKLLGLANPVKITGLRPAHWPYLEWHFKNKFQRT